MTAGGVLLAIFGVWLIARTVVTDSSGQTLVGHITALGTGSSSTASTAAAQAQAGSQLTQYSGTANVSAGADPTTWARKAAAAATVRTG